MEFIEVCKVVKFMGWEVWGDGELAKGVLDVLEVDVESIGHRDIMTVVAVVMGSGLKNGQVRRLIVKLMDRKKKLEQLTNYKE